MKLKTLLLSCGSVFIAAQLTAQWALVDDFQDGNVDDWLFDTVNLGEGNALAAVPEPFAGGNASNYVLEMDPGISQSEGPSSSATTRRVRAARSMPEIDNLGTLYVRMAQPKGEGDIFSIINNVWGVGPAALDTIPNFNDFSALMRIEHTVHNFDVYDGTIDTATAKAKGYQNVATELAMETWYEIWITIDHNNSSFAVYVRGGPEFPEQVKVYPAAEGEMAGYRNLTFDPMASFMIIATTGTIGDARSVDNFYVDDIYVDTTGHNLSSPLPQGWALVDDFEDGNVDDWLFDTVNLGEGNALAAVPEPFTGGDPSNHVLEMDPGISQSEGPSSSATTRRVRAARSMPEIDNLGTVYVRMAQPKGEGDIFSIINNVWGVGPAALDTIPNFNDFSALMRIEHTVHNYDVYDGTIDTATAKAKGYQNVATELAMETWYEIWITIDHNNSSFAVYVRGGPEFPEQVKVYPAAEGEMAGYRNLTFDPMASFMIIATTGTIGDARSVDNFYVDDIYVDTTGHNLSSPLGDAVETWNGFPIERVEGNAWVDTGSWMGWVFVENSPIIYVLDFDSWGFISESSINPNGAWTYIFK